MEGPYGKMRYHGNGDFQLFKEKAYGKKHIFMLGGGTGITPLYSIAQASVRCKDGVKINLLYSNKT